MTTGILILVASYILGGIPFGYLLVKWTRGQDIRASGSGNIGATNVLRTAGRVAGITTLALDIAKGYVAVWLAGLLTGKSPLWMSAAAVAVMLGHAFPAALKFKGGKAVATCVGAFLALAPAALGIAVIVFVGTVVLSRVISLGSILSAVSLPLAVWLVGHPPAPVITAAVFAAVFVIWRHKSNIQRLLAGNENVFSFGGRAH